MRNSTSWSRCALWALPIISACNLRPVKQDAFEPFPTSPKPAPRYWAPEVVDTLPIEPHAATQKPQSASPAPKPMPEHSTATVAPPKAPAIQPHTTPKARIAKVSPAPPTPSASAPVPAAPSGTLRSSPLSKDKNRKTLVIGDSLLAGGVGTKLASVLSQHNNEACVLSVSGSNYNNWTKGSLRNVYGANQRYSVNGEAKGVSYGKSLTKAAVSDMSLESALKAPSSVSCGDQAFDSLVVSLGANHGPKDSVNAYIDEVILIAAQHNIPKENIRFILPPGKKYSPHYYKNINQSAAAHLAKHGLVPFDTTTNLSIADNSFNDEEHFYGSTEEKLWGDKLELYLMGSPDLVEKQEKTDKHSDEARLI